MCRCCGPLLIPVLFRDHPKNEKELMNVDIKAIKKRFQLINRERLKRTQNALRWKQRYFLELLPIFFHINHALLPGYISKDTPAGIAQFVPSKKGLEALKKMAKSFVYRKRAMRSYDIFSIFLMGSVGTIAHSDKSDFDIWICHDPQLGQAPLAELRVKCTAIERWADSYGLEVHFFLMNAEQFARGDVHELSSESSGSTQHHLLLEEFYRTSLLVAGRYPLWWVVPPEQEKNYTEFTQELLHKRFISANEAIDFGGLAEIPVEEFFGAALWQVYKGIDSPYKSVLKILLMETYASAYPDIELLCVQYKRMIYDGIIDLNLLDPYNILISNLESYLLQRDEPERVELVRRCFYFKVNLPLSELGRNADDWQRDLLWDTCQKWGWDEVKLAMLDMREKWKIDRVLQERKSLVDELTHSYLFLSGFARKYSSLTRISQKDLNILGRKLYAAFERKAGKIELVNRGVSANIFEKALTLQQIVAPDGEENWLLMNRSAEGDDRLKLLRRARGVAELLAWCHFNRLINPGTVINLDAKQGILTLKEVKSILDTLDRLFPNGEFPPMQIEYFAQPPVVLGGCVFTNVGMDPLPNHTRRGTDIVSDRSDVLNYSGFSFNLALSFDLLLVTSWQEILTYRYSGVDGLLNALCQYLRWQLNMTVNEYLELPAFSFSSSHSTAIAQRIEQLFADVSRAFFGGGQLRQQRYVIEVQQAFYVLYPDNENFAFERAENQRALMEYLSRPQPYYLPIVADRFALLKTSLPMILPKNEAGKIQLFYDQDGNNANVYVLDEYGSLFHQQLPYHDDHALLNQYSLFLNSVLNRQGFMDQGGDELVTLGVDDIIFCKVSKSPMGRLQFERKKISVSKLQRSYFHVQVIGNLVDQKTVFTVYCEDREFSSFDHGNLLFAEAARHVYSRRASGSRYPIFITDLDLAPGLLGQRASNRVQIIEYLNYKKRIEEKLNSALREV